MKTDQHTKAIFVLGPTAAGKSKLALSLAQKFNGSIVNCDSIQFYKHLKIGSAAPSDADMNLVPHYLYAYVNPPDEVTAGQFLRDFYHLIENQKDLKYPLIIVGGTGFYIQALEKGMYNVPPIDPQLKLQIEDEIKKYGNEKAYQELIAFDPSSKIHVNDAYRIGRALEVKRAFNLKMSELKDHAQKFENSEKKLKLPFPSIKIGVSLPREILKERIAKRTQEMLKAGFIQEVENLIQAGFSNWAPMDSIGYFEIKEFLQGRISKNDLEEKINQSTRLLTKKQRTWFQRDPEIKWVDPSQSVQIEEIYKHVELFLS